MKSAKIFTGNLAEAGLVQQVLNQNNIGTWVIHDQNEQGSITIYIEAVFEEKAARLIGFNQLKNSHSPDFQENCLKLYSYLGK